jgi:hypothetical protein
MDIIKEHVANRADVQKIAETGESVSFVIADNYAVEIRMDGSQYVVSYNGSFDHNGQPLSGCWEWDAFLTPEQVFAMLDSSSDWN